MSRALYLVLLAAGLVALAAYEVGADDNYYAPNNQCCVPATTGQPTPPQGATTDCKIDPNNPLKCVNAPLFRCHGAAYEPAISGHCDPQYAKSCNDKGVTQAVICRRGTFQCQSAPAGGCCAWLADDPPPTQNVTKPSCTGDGCP